MIALGPEPCPRKTRSDLEWDRLLTAIAARCSTPLGVEIARALPFASCREEATTWAREGSEALTQLQGGTPVPAATLTEVNAALARIAGGGILGAVELRSVVVLLSAARVLRRFLEARRDTCPALATTCTTDPALDGLAAEVGDCFDSDGTLSDKASPRLRELRCEHRTTQARLRTKLEQFMSRHEHVLQERYVTERDGRWVVPVRAAAVKSLSGTIIGESSSGSTLFFEPDVVAPMTSKLRALEGAIEREEAAIYARLSARLCERAGSIKACASAIGRADVRGATAKLARDLRLTFPRLIEEHALTLRAARHPLLVLDLGDAVPSDIDAAGGTCLVVSGPNAGGKTVALKALGLAVLMARAGLPVACDEGSSVGLFDVVLTDVGDEQSLQKNLSTFSAHITNVATILERTRAGALVLLDELASGTDPREGEALASGILVSLCLLGGAVAVTTHYEGLKALALNDDARFRNASVGFDFERMRPTFRLRVGVPGGSSAFAVAERFGITSQVLTCARGFLSAEAIHFDQLVRRLNEERIVLEEASQALRARPEPAETRVIVLPDDLPAVLPAPEPLPLPAAPLRKGAKVFVSKLKRDGEIMEVLGGGTARVRVGNLKMVLPVVELVARPVTNGAQREALDAD
jgi:DNA mismatch repair protein MutS2